MFVAAEYAGEPAESAGVRGGAYQDGGGGSLDGSRDRADQAGGRAAAQREPRSRQLHAARTARPGHHSQPIADLRHPQADAGLAARPRGARGQGVRVEGGGTGRGSHQFFWVGGASSSFG